MESQELDFYMESGESFDVHFSSRAGTGYSWVNDHQFESNEEKNIKFEESRSEHD